MSPEEFVAGFFLFCCLLVGVSSCQMVERDLLGCESSVVCQ